MSKAKRMKTLEDAYKEDFIDGPESGKSFREWLSHIPGFYLECCKTGILFTFTEAMLDQIQPDDPCVCYEYLDVIKTTPKNEIREFGIKELANVRVALAGRPTSIGRSIYEGPESTSQN